MCCWCSECKPWLCQHRLPLSLIAMAVTQLVPLPAVRVLLTEGVPLAKSGCQSAGLSKEILVEQHSREQLASTRCAWPFAYQHKQITSRRLRQGSRASCAACIQAAGDVAFECRACAKHAQASKQRRMLF